MWGRPSTKDEQKKDNRRKILVKDFNPRVISEQDLLGYFGVYGAIETINIEPKKDNPQLASCLMSFEMEGQPVKLALDSQPHSLKGSSLRLGNPKEVNEAQVHEPNKQIYIKLYDHKIVSRADILQHFKQFGDVIDIHIPQNTRQSRTKKSFCYLTYKLPRMVDYALSLSPHVVNGETLEVVDVQTPMPSEGPKPMQPRDNRPRKGGGKGEDVWQSSDWKAWQQAQAQSSSSSNFPAGLDESQMQQMVMQTFSQVMSSMMGGKGYGKGGKRSGPY